MTAALSVAVDSKGNIRSVGKTGGGGIDLGVMRAMMRTARDVGGDLIRAVDGFFITAAAAAQGDDDDDDDDDDDQGGGVDVDMGDGTE